MPDTHCSKCDSQISPKAKVCPVCHSDLRDVTFGARLLSLRDYVTLPTAVLALVAALADPIGNTVRKTFGWDGASIEGSVLSVDVINVGLDDRSADKRVEKVTQYEKLLRIVLYNAGYSFAAIGSSFNCFVDDPDNEKTVYFFKFFDPKLQTKNLPEMKAKETVSLVSNLTGSQEYSEDMASIVVANKCVLGYTDKYSFKRLLLDFKPSMLRSFDKY